MVMDGWFVQKNARLPMEVNVSGKVILVTASQSPKRKSGITLTGNSRSVSQIGCYINRSIQSIYNSLGGEIPTPLTNFCQFSKIGQKLKSLRSPKNKKSAKVPKTAPADYTDFLKNEKTGRNEKNQELKFPLFVGLYG